MDLVYPTFSEIPFLLMTVETGGRFAIFPMIVDTGADATCFPARFARMIGHNNLADGVEMQQALGVCGKTHVYMHTLRLSLLSPAKPASDRELPPPVWTSSIRSFGFVARFTGRFGLLGRDVIREWKSLSLRPEKNSWTITISV